METLQVQVLIGQRYNKVKQWGEVEDRYNEYRKSLEQS